MPTRTVLNHYKGFESAANVEYDFTVVHAEVYSHIMLPTATLVFVKSTEKYGHERLNFYYWSYVHYAFDLLFAMLPISCPELLVLISKISGLDI